MRYKRLISDKIAQLSTQYPCVVLTGARQVGKTTLLKHMFPNHKILSLDLPSLAEQAEHNPQLFLSQNPPPLLIDEVQYAPGLFRHLKIVIDQNRHQMGQYILTGSQQFPLMKEVSESLAGRAAILNLETLSVREIFQNPNPDWVHVISRGLYPELWRQPDLDPHTFYSSYLATYLERDLRQILNVQSLRDFERFIRACSARSGSLLNYSDLGRDVGIKAQTAKDWMSALVASNMIFLLEPYFENVGKRIVKSPKLYLSDPGLLCYLLGLDQNSVTQSPLVGNIWETFVYAEFRKRVLRNTGGSLWFYRDAQGKEIDFLYSGEGAFDLFEVKWMEEYEMRWIDNLREVGEILGKSKSHKLRNLYFINRTQTQRTVQGVCVENPYHLSLQ